MLALAIVLSIFATALLLARPWKRPSPKHEFMLDLYARMLGSEPDEGKTTSVSQSSGRSALRRVG